MALRALGRNLICRPFLNEYIMKQVIVIMFILIVCPSLSYSQRLNDLGLKMVKEFTIQEFSKGQPSNEIKYNKKDKMISLDIYKNEYGNDKI